MAIEALVKQLISELEAKGYTMDSTEALGGFDINIRNYTGEIYLNNILGGWSIECGKIEVAE